MTDKEALERFQKKGYYMDSQEVIRCMCDNKIVSMRSETDHMLHFCTQKHKKMMALRSKMKSRKAYLSFEEAHKRYASLGYFFDKEGILRCHCNNKAVSSRKDMSAHQCHFNTKKHRLFLATIGKQQEGITDANTLTNQSNDLCENEEEETEEDNVEGKTGEITIPSIPPVQVANDAAEERRHEMIPSVTNDPPLEMPEASVEEGRHEMIPSVTNDLPQKMPETSVGVEQMCREKNTEDMIPDGLVEDDNGIETKSLLHENGQEDMAV